MPLTGFPTRALYYQPRFGAAYDLFGTGKTILRGGWGRFYYHSGQFTNGLDLAAGSAAAHLARQTDTTGSTCTDPSIAPLFARNVSCINAAANPASPFAVDRKDDKQPFTDSWSFTVAQQTPLQGLLEVAYVGNRSKDQLNIGGAGNNLNLAPVGAIFNDPTVINPSLANPDKYRPLNTCCDANGNPQGYGDVNTAISNIYTNYNGLQITWGRHAGRYVPSKLHMAEVLGNCAARQSGQQPLGNPEPVQSCANYGVQPGDRRQLFNIAYSIELGQSAPLDGFLGGLRLPAGSSLESRNFRADPISPMPAITTAQTLTLTCSSTMPSFRVRSARHNPNGIQINNQSILGTNAIQLNPFVTCNPTSNLGPHQYINGDCFAAPTVAGKNGPTVLPAVYGPGYFNSDLGVFKNFSISEAKKLQFRVQMYNFLNHPLWSFHGSNNLSLKFTQDPTTRQSLPRATRTLGKQRLRMALA